MNNQLIETIKEDCKLYEQLKNEDLYHNYL